MSGGPNYRETRALPQPYGAAEKAKRDVEGRKNAVVSESRKIRLERNTYTDRDICEDKKIC